MRHLRPGHVASPHVRHAKGHPGEVVIKRSRGKFPRPSAMVKQSTKIMVENLFKTCISKYADGSCMWHVTAIRLIRERFILLRAV